MLVKESAEGSERKNSQGTTVISEYSTTVINFSLIFYKFSFQNIIRKLKVLLLTQNSQIKWWHNCGQADLSVGEPDTCFFAHVYIGFLCWNPVFLISRETSFVHAHTRGLHFLTLRLWHYSSIPLSVDNFPPSGSLLLALNVCDYFPFMLTTNI